MGVRGLAPNMRNKITLDALFVGTALREVMLKEFPLPQCHTLLGTLL